MKLNSQVTTIDAIMLSNMIVTLTTKPMILLWYMMRSMKGVRMKNWKSLARYHTHPTHWSFIFQGYRLLMKINADHQYF